MSDLVEVEISSFDAVTREWSIVKVMEPAGVYEVPDASSLLSYAADIRWKKQQGPAYINGILVRTDTESRNLINGAKGLAEMDPDLITPFKSASGWVELTSPQVIGLAEAVGRYVLSCFALERAVSARIESGTITTFAEIESAFA